MKKRCANRRGAKKMFGPRSVSGKARSSKNARKHGLNTSIWADRGLSEMASKIASLIVGENANDELIEQALVIAETEVQLQQVQRVRTATIGMELAPASRDSRRDIEVENNPEAEAFARAAPRLLKLDRYERRALSRRKKALERLEYLQWLHSEGENLLKII